MSEYVFVAKVDDEKLYTDNTVARLLVPVAFIFVVFKLLSCNELPVAVLNIRLSINAIGEFKI